MPELPEVEALADFVTERCAGRVVTSAQLLSFSALKTFDPPLTALQGAEVTGATRRGKFLDIDVSGTHLVVHLGRAGWLRWREEQPSKPIRPGGPIALRLRFDDGSGIDLTEAGTQKKLSVHLTADPLTVPGVAALGPDPLADDFTVETLAGVLAAAGGARIKGVLRDQKQIAGIGNAYSDEILHAARLSPYAAAKSLDADATAALHATIREVLGTAVERSRGLPAADLKNGKRAGMAVHGRTGERCPVCGDTVAEVSFADSSLQYCPTCQTGGNTLADRRMSRLLR